MTVKTSISLTDDQEAYARSLVESGQYPSLSAVLQHGLDMMRRESEMRDREIEALRLFIDQRRAGAFVDIESGETQTREMRTRKRNPLQDWRGVGRDQDTRQFLRRRRPQAVDHGSIS